MCGRASSARSAPAIRALTGAVRAIARSEYRPSWNVGPGNRAPVLRRVRAREDDDAAAPSEAPPAHGGAAPVVAATPDGAGASASSASADVEVIDDDSVVVVGDTDDGDDHAPAPAPAKPSPAKKAKPTPKDDHPTAKPADKKDDDNSKGGGHGPTGGGGAVRRGGATASAPASSSAPTTTGGGVGGGAESELIVQSMRWGILPPYAGANGGKQFVINARSETVGQKSLFKRLVEKRRCIVPVDGFYEWEKKPDPFGGKDKKQPFFIHLPDRNDLPTRKQLLTGDGQSNTATAAHTPTGPSAAGAADQKSPKKATATATAAGLVTSKWFCSACTLINTGTEHGKCSACGKPRKSPAAAKAEAELIEDDEHVAAAPTATATAAATAASGAGAAAATGDDAEATDVLGDAVLTTRPLMLLAGLYDEWVDSATGSKQFSYTILTTDANSSSSWLHDRLPLILDDASARVWLDVDRYSFADCLKFVKPYASALLFYAVSTNVNFMANKGIECVEPLQSVEQKKKAGGISRFFSAASASATASAAKETAGKTPKGDPHSWAGALDAWKRVEETIAAYNKRTGGGGAAAAAAPAATTSAKGGLNTGKRKDSSAAPRTPPKSPAKPFGK